MILFFYGEDTYRLHQKLKALKEKFISASLGDTNLSILDGGSVTYDEFIRQILAMPFLSKSRLVIVENIIKEGKKEVLEKIPESLAKVPSSTVLVFVEQGNSDKRISLFKKLNKPGTSQEFKLLDDIGLRRWIVKELEARNAKWESLAVTKLIEYVGNDLWRLSNELDKLTTYNQQLTTDSVELLVNPQVESNVFDMVEAVAKKNHRKAVKELYKLLDSGQHELYVLTMLVWQFRNLLIIKDFAVRDKSSNSWALAKKAGLSPFVVQKAMAIISTYSLEELKKIYGLLLNFDIKIKTGKMEPQTALELLIYRLTAKNNQ